MIFTREKRHGIVMLIRIPLVFLNKMVAGSYDYGKIR